MSFAWNYILFAKAKSSSKVSFLDSMLAFWVELFDEVWYKDLGKTYDNSHLLIEVDACKFLSKVGTKLSLFPYRRGWS